MTEVKKDVVPAADAPKPTLEARRIVLPEGGGTPEEIEQAVENYKKAKMQFETARIENDRKEKEIKEKNEDKPGEKLDTGLATEPSSKDGTAISYEMKSGEGTPNISHNLLPGQEAPKDAVKVHYAPATTEKPKSQEEIALDDKRESEKKSVLEALTKKHQSEIEKNLKDLDFTKLDDETRRNIHTEEVYSSIDTSKVSDIVKKEALENVQNENGGSVDVTKPLSPDQIKIMQSYQANKYLKTLSNEISPEVRNNSEKLKKRLEELERLNPGISDFVSKNNSAIFQKEHFEKGETQERIKQIIREKGIALSGINPNSEFAREMRETMQRNIDEYMKIRPLVDNTMSLDDFKGLKDVLGAGYNDLFSDPFILGDDHPLKKTKDTARALYKDAMAQYEVPDVGDEKATKEYQEIAKQELANATGLSTDVAGQMVNSSPRNLVNNPIIRFLADLLAPIGALMGPPVGDFWRNYLSMSGTGSQSMDNAYGPGQSSPVEGAGIEGAKSGSIHEAASKYIGISESSNPDKIKEFHQSGGSAVRGAGTGTAWCMSFVQHVLRKDMGYTDAAQIGKPTAWARDGHKMGRHTDTPKKGDIVLVKSSAANSGRHIGFFDSLNSDGSVNVLGGNQGNSVSVKKFGKSSIAEFRTLETGPAGTPGNTINQGSVSGDLSQMTDIKNTPNTRHQEKIQAASNTIQQNRERYERVAKATGVPWELIGAIHYREASFDFKAALHNGDKIIGTGRKTYRVPAGCGPFDTWEEAAIDALKRKPTLGIASLDGSDGQLKLAAEYAERFNGLGYRNKGRVSPYVWSGTSKYTGGRYVADHQYNPNSYDERPGVMPIVLDILKKTGTDGQNVT